MSRVTESEMVGMTECELVQLCECRHCGDFFDTIDDLDDDELCEECADQFAVECRFETRRDKIVAELSCPGAGGL